MEEDVHDADPKSGNGAARKPVLITIDLEALLQVVDLRPDASTLAAESEWTERHLAAARRALRGDFDPKSLAMFECLLSGERVSDVAARFVATEQAVHKVKQRVSKRLTEIVRRSIEIERRGDRRSSDRFHVCPPDRSDSPERGGRPNDGSGKPLRREET